MFEYRTFNSNEMKKILDSLNQELLNRKLMLELAIYCGVAVMLYYDRTFRDDSTSDFDGVILNKREFGSHPEVFLEIAKKYQLPENWINSQIIETLSEMKREDMIDFGDYSNIRIKMPVKEQLLAMKIKAARYYPKFDFEDSQQIIEDLGIQTLEELQDIVNEYIPKHLIGAEQIQFMQAVMEPSHA